MYADIVGKDDAYEDKTACYRPYNTFFHITSFLMVTDLFVQQEE